MNSKNKSKPKKVQLNTFDDATASLESMYDDVTNAVSIGMIIDVSIIVVGSFLGLVFLGVWVSGLFKMRGSCSKGDKFSSYWIATLILGLLPTGVTQLAAFGMAIYGMKHPEIGCLK